MSANSTFKFEALIHQSLQHLNRDIIPYPNANLYYDVNWKLLKNHTNINNRNQGSRLSLFTLIIETYMPYIEQRGQGIQRVHISES